MINPSEASAVTQSARMSKYPVKKWTKNNETVETPKEAYTAGCTQELKSHGNLTYQSSAYGRVTLQPSLIFLAPSVTDVIQHQQASAIVTPKVLLHSSRKYTAKYGISMAGKGLFRCADKE